MSREIGILTAQFGVYGVNGKSGDVMSLSQNRIRSSLLQSKVIYKLIGVFSDREKQQEKGEEALISSLSRANGKKQRHTVT